MQKSPLPPTRTGYKFDGWTDDNGEPHEDGKPVQNLTSDPEGKVTLTARWKANRYTVTLDPSQGTIEGGETEITVAYGEEYGENLPEPTREGYTFAGWFTDDNQPVNRQTKVGDVLDITTKGEHKLTAR